MVIVRSCLQNLRKWAHNPRFWIIGIIAVLFANDPAGAFRQVASASAKDLSPWMLPFLVCDRYLLFCITLCFIGLFCDAPFLDRLQPYVIQRIGRRKWMLGQFLYIVAASFLFFLFMWAAMDLLCLPHMKLTLSWGSCLTMLAHDNPFWGAFLPELILGKPAVAASLQVFLIGSLEACFIGALLLYMNLFMDRETSALIVAAVSVFDFVLYSYGDANPALFWISPISWMNPLQYVGVDMWKYNIHIIILCVLIIALFILSMVKFQKQNIEVMPEI